MGKTSRLAVKQEPNTLFFILEERLFRDPMHDQTEVQKRVPNEIRSLARMYLERSGGLLVSSTIALGTAIVAIRSSGDYDAQSPELGLLEAVLRLSEKRQVPPKLIMRALADEHPSLIVKRKLS